jgi:hypothetical protein
MVKSLLYTYIYIVAFFVVPSVNADIYDYSNIFLKDSDLPGFSLIFQKNDWSICVGQNQYQNAIIQQWRSDKYDLRIIYCAFKSIVEADERIAFFSHSFAGPYYWGSISGQVIGDKCWSANNAQLLLRGNICIQIISGTTNGNVIVEQVSAIILKRIEENLSNSIRRTEDEAKSSQIDSTLYNSIINAALSVPSASNYSLLKEEWDSKWRVDNTKFYLGRRVEWKNSEGTIIGIDVCKFSTQDDAKKANEIMKNETYGFSFDMNQISEVDSVIVKNCRNGITKKIVPLSLCSRNIAVLFYMIDPNKIDSDLFARMIQKAAEQISFQ